MVVIKSFRVIALSAGVAAATFWIASPAQAGSPSFNCAKADSRAEELICGDKELALMDVEATRLFRLARDGNGVTEKQKKVLNDDRASWLKLRDECWFSEDLRSCIVASYAVRIHYLRENHEATRLSDKEGITKGPIALHCDKLQSTVTATFIGSDPPISAIQLADQVHVGIGAGTRYIEKNENGEMAFWTKGDDAFLNMPSGARYNCKREKAK
jgi:uncharacterized protein